MTNKDPNWETDWIVVLMVDSSFVCDFGYASGKGTWLQARHFMNVQAARAAINDPSWHNDPEGIARAKPVRLFISVKPKHYED